MIAPSPRPRSARARAAWLGAAAALAVMLPAACAREKGALTQEQLLQEFYTAQIENLRALDQAFFKLGQEYALLDIEYQSMGRPELAEVTRKKAEEFHKQHLAFQAKITDIEQRNARVRRNEAPVRAGAPAGVQPPRPQQPAAAPARPPAAATPAPPRAIQPTPLPTPGAPRQAAPMPTPVRTPTPLQPRATPLPAPRPAAPTPTPLPPAPAPLPQQPPPAAPAPTPAPQPPAQTPAPTPLPPVLQPLNPQG